MSVLKIRDENGEFKDIITIKGEPGEDYILTEEDKQEIAKMVESSAEGMQALTNLELEEILK